MPSISVVPLTATLGYTTMRFMADFGVGTMNPCVISDITKRGETEDYTFNVILAPPAITLSGATTTICAGDNTAAISMTSVAANYTDYSWTPSLGVTPATGLGHSPSAPLLHKFKMPHLWDCALFKFFFLPECRLY